MKRVIFSSVLVLTMLVGYFSLLKTKSQPRHTLSNRQPESTQSLRATNEPDEDEDSEDAAEKWVAIADQQAVLNSKALPAFKSFLTALAGVGVSPIDPKLSTNRVVPVETGSNKYVLTCRFVVDDKWVVTFDDIPDTELTTRFRGISDFGQTGPQNPYRHVSAGDTKPLAALAHSNVMNAETASKLLREALSAVLGRSVPVPEVNAERYYGYDMNRWSARWWKPGADHWNQLNIQHSMVIQPHSPTQAVFVGYHRRAGE